MSTINRPINDPTARHAFILAMVLDRDHAPGFLRAITEDDRAWRWWLSLDDERRMGIAEKLLDRLIVSNDDAGALAIAEHSLALIDEQRDLYETIITAIAASGSKAAARALLRLRLMRHGITTGATH